MRIELIKEDGHTVGWKIIGENIDDKLTLGSIRSCEYWGSKEDKIEYNGMLTDPEDNRYVLSVNYATKAYNKKQKEAFYNSLEYKRAMSANEAKAEE